MDIAIISIVVALVIGLVSFAMISKQKAAKALEDKKAGMSNQISDIKGDLKSTLDRLTEKELLDKNQKHKLYSLANNYFVYQPINESSIVHLSGLVNQLVQMISLPESHVDEGIEPQRLSMFTNITTNFAKELPMETREYNSNFYHEELPRLLFDLSDLLDTAVIIDVNEVESEPEATVEPEQKVEVELKAVPSEKNLASQD